MRQRLTLLWLLVGIYAAGRICQIYADRLPSLLVVCLHVIPPAVFALAHGWSRYGLRGMAVFCISCLGIASAAELLSLHTGFPFGRYHFNTVMGPKFAGLPFLLALAYLGIGYAAWIVAITVLAAQEPVGTRGKLRVVALAAALMTLWDLAMDPYWADIVHAWSWHSSGLWLGVPLTNFSGWYVTAFLNYWIFASAQRQMRIRAVRSRAFTQPAIALYALCALGNLLLYLNPMAGSTVIDATGHRWATAGILAAMSAVSIGVMLPLAVLAWLRLPSATAHPSR